MKEKELNIKKVNNVKVSITMNDVPVWVVKEFCKNVDKEYNNCYWVKLIDLLRKAEAYDTFVTYGVVATGLPEEDTEPEEEIEEPKVPLTIGKKPIMTKEGVRK